MHQHLPAGACTFTECGGKFPADFVVGKM